jgi:membrane-bound lytic murein transglycosylase B
VAARAIAGWPRRPSGRIVLPGLLIMALIALSGFIGGFVVPALPIPTVRAFTLLEPVPDAGAADVPGADGSDTSTDGNQPATTRPADLRGWATPIATKLSIPVPAMQAYGYAELSMAVTEPNCQLRWTTLAGIGKIESNHGQHNAALAPNGDARPPILGDPLDGQHNNTAIKDTDQGQVDTDKTWDRAVGPMQFIPSTWAKFASDADGNGVADINNINDAALAAARYLCSGNRNLSTVGDWWAAILSYNALQQYANDVFQAANTYGLQSH